MSNKERDIDCDSDESDGDKGWFSKVSIWRFPVAVAILILLVRSVFIDYMHVPSGSMNPLLVDGDRIVVLKLAHGFRLPWTLIRPFGVSSPTRGDVVTFDSPENRGTWVKRVVALSGDKVQVVNGVLIVNGERSSYSSASIGEDVKEMFGEDMRQIPFIALTEKTLDGSPHLILAGQGVSARDFPEIVVPRGMVFVMGDNRDFSRDSRYFGPLPEKNLTGKVLAVGFSLAPKSWLYFRPSRWWLPV